MAEDGEMDWYTMGYLVNDTIMKSYDCKTLNLRGSAPILEEN